MPSLDKDSALSLFTDPEEAAAVTRADRCPISAPPTPTASAIDCAVPGDGWGETVSTEAVSVGVGDGGGTAGDGETASDEAAVGDGKVGAASDDVVVGDGDVGVGAGSTADATPARPGPAARVAARSAIPKDINAGRRD
ncbi:hypothetical protein NCCP2145_10850 [Pseudarthrobacter sp. NCCP-2145]|nr:hypothetical protein NCCP2145_10850 [Pseudarthrobacter sp. NCCP-2145]